MNHGYSGKSNTFAINGLEQIVDVFADAVSVFIPPVTDCANVIDCSLCFTVMLDPVTLPCGHTICKKCALTNESLVNPKLHCHICKASYNPFNLKSNVVIAKIIEKWWPDAMKAALLRKEGNLLVDKHFEDAIAIYKKAIKIDPQNHSSALNLSEALLKAGRAEESLSYADIAIKSNPRFAKNYFVKASALVSLGRYELAIVSYLHCLHFGFNILEVKKEILKLLHKIVQQGQLCQHSSSIIHCKPTTKRDELNLSKSSFNERYSENDGSGVTLKLKLNRTSLHQKKKESEKLQKLFEHCMQEIKIINSIRCHNLSKRSIIWENIEKRDLECPLCMRLLWEPVTTPCGHMYCQRCLDRSLDHQVFCPLCKFSLEEYLAERKPAITEVVELSIKNFLPEEATEREKAHEEELIDLKRAGTDSMQDVPLFICTIAFPTISCPLHIFEPRYRLMTRQCIESGSRIFGMCASLPNVENGTTTYGTMLMIRDMHFLPDGRSIIDTVGGKRFKVLNISMRDGYHIGSIEYITDEPVDIGSEEAKDLKVMHDYVYYTSGVWFEGLSTEIQQRIIHHFGPRPPLENENLYTRSSGPAWFWWLVAVLPLETQLQMNLLGINSLRKRLEVIYRVLEYLQSKPV